MSRSYYEKLARIDLTAGTVAVEPLELEKAQRYIGGRGLGTKILYDEGIATVDPLGPGNKLVYITGPMTGTPSPSASLRSQDRRSYSVLLSPWTTCSSISVPGTVSQPTTSLFTA